MPASTWPRTSAPARCPSPASSPAPGQASCSSASSGHRTGPGTQGRSADPGTLHLPGSRLSMPHMDVTVRPAVVCPVREPGEGLRADVDFDIPAGLAAYLAELDEFIELQIRP